MKPSDFQKTIQCQFDCKLKRVVKGIVRNYRKELKRRRNANAGMNPKALQYVMGHSNITITLNLYAHAPLETRLKRN